MINKDEIINSNYIFKANPKLSDRSKIMSRNMTLAEKLIWFNILSKRQLLGYKFVKQKLIFNYIVDFYCSKLLLIIEIDGPSHNLKIDYDKTRDEFLRSAGLTIIRIRNEKIIDDIEVVKEFLVNFINNRLNSPL
jgi:very-short-patch-repair endonuclease